MTKRLVLIFFSIIFTVSLVLLQFSLISSLPYPWHNINLLIVALILGFLTNSKEQAWFLAISLGYFSDSF